MYDGKKLELYASSTRDEKNWGSNVFSDSYIEQPRRKPLAKKDAGYEGLYGNEE